MLMRSRCCLCVCVSVSPIFARQRLGRNVTAVMNTHATIEKFLDASFSVWPVSYQGKYAISSSQYLLFSLPLYLTENKPHIHYKDQIITVGKI
jgi:hypothetical protein